MLNRNPKFEMLTLKISKHKVIFRKYPSKEDENKPIYYIDIWQRHKDEKTKKSSYSLQLFHKEFSADDKFDYTFDVDGLWSCLEDFLNANKRK